MSLGFTAYSSRPEWKDITPIPQDDGPHPAVPIAYSEQCTFFTSPWQNQIDHFFWIIFNFNIIITIKTHICTSIKTVKETHDYFRAILNKNEISKRALDLTADLISMNAANYTAWYVKPLPLFIKRRPANTLTWSFWFFWSFFYHFNGFYLFYQYRINIILL